MSAGSPAQPPPPPSGSRPFDAGGPPPPPPFGFSTVSIGSPAPPPPGGINYMPQIPPLPYGWIQHTAPDGHTPYYYNTLSQESTYVRPLPNLMPPTGMPSILQPPAPEPKKKKEKPKEKTLIPGTTWTKVVTTEGNVFYTEKETKKSSWTVPEEIKREVEVYQESLEQEAKAKVEEERRKKEQERVESIRERERIRLDIEAERQRKQEEETQRVQEREAQRKRKEMEAADADEDDRKGEDGRPTKVAKLEGSAPPEEAADEDEQDEGQAGPLDEEDEEAWQKAVAAEIAAEHAAADVIKKAEKKKAKSELEEAKRTVFQAPTKVDLTLEEGRALFRALLHEKDISPFAPWENSLPLFINDPRYILLTSQKDRRDVYEEYCRDVARAKRIGKSSNAIKATGSSDEKKDSERDYRELLRTEVQSTRTIWDEFRRAWKKDRRFWSYGKDDRAREKLFRTHLKEVGERKRSDAKRAELDFVDLLKEHSGIRPDSEWRLVKRAMTEDPRYDAVGSSSLREQLFHAYSRSLASEPEAEHEGEEKRRAREKKERAVASLQERERTVQEAKVQANRELHRSRIGAGKEDGEREFGSLLVQAIREHDAKWSDIAPQLEKDARFNHPSLQLADKQRLFRAHLNDVAKKRLAALHTLFAKHAPELNTPFDEVYPEIVDEFAVKRLHLSHDDVANHFDAWQRVRFQNSRREFDALLSENSFVEFWGRMRKKTLDEGAMAIKDEDEDEDEDLGAGGGGRASLTEMAKQIDVADMHSVLQNDKRYTTFDYIPDQRDAWLREYLDSLEEAKATVHQTGA